MRVSGRLFFFGSVVFVFGFVFFPLDPFFYTLPCIHAIYVPSLFFDSSPWFLWDWRRVWEDVIVVLFLSSFVWKSSRLFFFTFLMASLMLIR